ncbi:MAG: hypothetical protein Q4C47_07270 [Planctomycetia bacterium]|nr:hypothetical protein [Planctomycetia bacterium]
MLGVLIGWLLFVVISWTFGLGPAQDRGVGSSPTESPEERISTESDDPYDPYGNLAPMELPTQSES